MSHRDWPRKAHLRLIKIFILTVYTLHPGSRAHIAVMLPVHCTLIPLFLEGATRGQQCQTFHQITLAVFFCISLEKT